MYPLFRVLIVYGCGQRWCIFYNSSDHFVTLYYIESGSNSFSGNLKLLDYMPKNFRSNSL